jgi:sialidase-1
MRKIVTAITLLLVFLSSFACKKGPIEKVNKLFPNVNNVKATSTVLFGKLSDSSSYTLKVIESNNIFSPNSQFSAYSFGDLLKLDKNKILCIASRFPVLDDFGYAEFAYKVSEDNGTTWTKEELFMASTSGINIMSPNLLRIDTQKVVFVYAHKVSNSVIDIYIQKSTDNAVTFDSPRKINTVHGYQAFNNARIMRLKSGRIILPVSIAEGLNTGFYKVFCYYSDDLGETWHNSSLLSSDVSLMEPGVVELPSGELLMVLRTREGVLYFSKSSDKGATWKTLYHSELTTPESPATLLTYKDKLVLFWNRTTYVPNDYRNRTPLNIAVSDDYGASWTMIGKIENNESFQYSYLSAFEDNNDIYLTYYKRGRQDDRSHLVFSKILIENK